MAELAQPDNGSDPWAAFGGLTVLWWCVWAIRRRLARRSDPTLLPLCCALSGLGWVEVYRLDPDLGLRQAMWLALGLLVFVLTLWLVRDFRRLEDFRYLYFFAGIGLQLAVMIFGVEINGARLWFRFGSLQFQPVEVVKIFMILFLAAYFRRFRQWMHSDRQGRLPRRALLMLALGWMAALGVLVLQKDLGMALLFMGVFLAMFYVATGRAELVGAAGALFVVGAAVGYRLFGHVRVRVQAWLDPFAHAETGGYQMCQALFSLSWGGLFGTGLGMGKPQIVPEAATDFIFVALAEELGLLGAVAILLFVLLLVQRACRIAMACRDEFSALVGIGLATLLALQSLIIVGGTLKVIPMTGITLPFVSYGGSSMLANFLILALFERLADGD
ncbi:MAG: FtsW/RodA/SpoVE family cell cycle protein [Vulcanimicrobiota bacterium]